MDNLFPKGYKKINLECRPYTLYIGEVGSEMCSRSDKGEQVIFHNTMYVFKNVRNYEWDGKIILKYSKDRGILYYSTDGREIFVYEEDEEEWDTIMDYIDLDNFDITDNVNKWVEEKKKNII
jgi:hypothetical protein